MTYKLLGIDDAVISVHITDTLRLSDQEAVQAMAKKLIDKGQKARMLVVIDHFQGWEHNAKWEDISFLMDYGDDIEKIAVVAEERWKDQALLFAGKGFRDTDIEFFALSSLQQAEQWVRA